LAHHSLAAASRDLLHCTIPRNNAAVAIKREEAIDARVEQALQ
jgi:hypothetical protein